MAKLSIDTDKVKAAGEEVKVIAKDYKKIINDTYNLIKNMENAGIWMSESEKGSAKKFINSVLKDYPDASALANSMNDLGNRVVSYANSVNNISDNRL